MEKIKLSEIKPNEENPRIISQKNYERLLKSITDFPKMLEIRPLVIDENNIVLGGNMRLKALTELGYTEVPVIREKNLTDEEKKEFIIKDNIGYGEWDWDALANTYETEKLEEWGLDVPNFQTDEIEEDEKETGQMWFLNIQLKDENECQKWYEKLIKEGLNCKIVQ